MRLNKMFLVIITILGLILVSIPAMAQPSLVASYPFNGNANDESGNGHDGINSGAALSTDRFGNPDASYYFDASGTTINVASSPAFGPDLGIIIDLWIRPTAYPDLVGTGWEYHKGILYTTTETHGFALSIYSDSTIGFAVAPTPWVEVKSQTRVPLNTWTNLRATYCVSSGDIRLFVNGVLEGSTLSSSRQLGESGIVIGRNPFAFIPSQPCAFQGEIDDISIWNWGDGEELVSDENTVALYHMNESSGSSVADASSFANHGTAQNSQIVDGYADLGRSTAPNIATYGILVPGSPSLNTLGTGSNKALTLEAFVYLEDYENCGLEIIKKNDQYALTLGSYGSTGYLQLQLWPDGAAPSRVIQSPNQIPLNQWVHLAASWDGAFVRLFIDGSLVHMEAADVTLLATNSDLRIGDYYLVDTPPTGKMIRIDEVRISNITRYSDIIRVGNPSCLQSLLPTQQTIPIYLDNPDTVKGLDIPMSYTWSVDPDSISFVGTRLSGVQGALRSIDAGTNRMRVVWTWSGDPAELMLPIDVNSANVPIAKIFMPANYACSDDLVNPPDTATVMLPLGPIHVEVTDKFAAKTVPVIVADNTLVRHYLKGDANWDKSVSISDPVFLINYIFAGGAAPFCSIAADADGNGIVNISDAVFLINYVFAGGPTPGAVDLCSPPPSFPKAAIGHANIATRFSANETSTAVAVSLGNSSDARAIQLDFAITGDVRNIQIKSDVSELQLFSSEVGYRVGLIDLTGTAAIPSGTSQIATITYEGTGALTITSAIVVDNDASEMNVEISNAKLESTLPTEYSLGQNQPNPFNPTTDISFSLPTAAQVKLVVYNILGAEVAALVDEVRSAGLHRITWDGRDNSGNKVASGIYLYRLTAGGFSATKKMMLLK